MTRLRPTRAATPSGSLQVQSSVRLMDDFISTEAVAAESDLVAIQPASGPYALLAADADGLVRCLWQSASSDTGWIEETLPEGVSAAAIATGVDGAGGTIAFAMPKAASDATLWWSRRDPSAGWGTWQAIAPAENLPDGAVPTVIAATADAGTVRLFATLRDSDGNGSLWSVDWSDPVSTWTSLGDALSMPLCPATLANGGASLVFARASGDGAGLKDLCAVPQGGGVEPIVLAASLPFTTLTTGMQPNGMSAIFFANDGALGEAQIQYLDGADPSAPVVVDSSIAAASLRVVGGAAGLILFATDTKGFLHLIATPTLSEQSDDFDFSLAVSKLVAATDRDGNPELVAQLPGAGLIRLWRNPPTGPQERRSWSQSTIAYQPGTTRLTETSTYAIDLTIYAANGTRLASQPILLGASAIVPVRIRGVSQLLGPKLATGATTDRAGRVRITMPVGSINCAPISVKVPGVMGEDEVFSVTPDFNMRTRLARITVDEVAAVVAPVYQADAAAIQNTIQQSILAVEPAPIAIRYQPVGPAGLWTPIRGVADRPGAHAFRVSGGRATFTPCDRDEALDRLKAWQGLSPDDLFDDFDDALEEIGDAVEDAVDYTYDHVLTPVADGIQVGFRFVADGIDVAWTGLIETVEDAFRFIETVMDAVGAFFERLYDFFAWLLSGALEDIWRTKTYLDQAVAQGFTDLAGFAASAERMSDSFFADLGSQVKELFDEAQRAVGGDTPGDATNAQPALSAENGIDETFLELLEDGAVVSGWFFDKIMEVLGLDFDADFPEDMLDSLQALLDRATTLVGDVLEALCSNFVDAIQKLADNVDAFGEILLGTFIAEARTIVSGVLAMLDELVKDFLAFFGQYLPIIADRVFGAGIGNDVAQALYDLVNPGESEALTVTRLGTLMVAFFATVSYKLIFDDVPFPERRRADAMSEAGVLTILAGLVQTTLWLIVDLKSDQPVDDADKFMFVAANLLCPLLIQLLTRPAGEPSFEDPDTASRWVAWFAGFGGIAFNTAWAVLMIREVVPGGPRSSRRGAMGLCACGGLGLFTNIGMGLQTGASPATWISGIASPLSALAKPARQLIADPVAAFTTLAIVDVVSDCGGGIAKIVKGAAAGRQSSSEACPTVPIGQP